VFKDKVVYKQGIFIAAASFDKKNEKFLLLYSFKYAS
jgi:hypothetical protein